MNVRLGAMRPGQWRELSEEELSGLMGRLN